MQSLKQQLVTLRRKYEVLLDMRRAREALEQRGVMRFSDGALAQRSAQARAVAEAFPGALREQDQLDAAALARRLAAVDTAIAAGGAHLPIWLAVMLDFHALLREALTIKAWLAQVGLRRRLATTSDLARFKAWFATSEARVTEHVDIAFLNRYISPPQGRLLELVWQELERRHGQSPAELKQIAFGPS